MLLISEKNRNTVLSALTVCQCTTICTSFGIALNKNQFFEEVNCSEQTGVTFPGIFCKGN